MILTRPTSFTPYSVCVSCFEKTLGLMVYSEGNLFTCDQQYPKGKQTMRFCCLNTIIKTSGESQKPFLKQPRILRKVQISLYETSGVLYIRSSNF